MSTLKKHYALFALLFFLSACANGPETLELNKNPTKINDRYQWDLTDLYPDLNAWNLARTNALMQVADLTKLQGSLGQSGESLLYASDRISSVYKDVVRIYIYANLSADEDVRNAENQERVQLARNLFTDLTAATSWYSPELLAIGEKN